MVFECGLQITIPSDDTTYWCSAFELPQAVVDQTHYVTKVIKLITKIVLVAW